MIDAVFAVTQAAPLLRGNLDQTSTADSYAVNPDRVQKAATQSYVSPYYEIDAETQTLVYEVRDTTTGKALLKVSSPLSAKNDDTVSTYDSNAQIRTASQTLSPSSTVTSQSTSQTSGQTTSSQASLSPLTTPAPQTTTASQDTSGNSGAAAQTVAAFGSAQQAGNINAGAITFDQIV